MNTRTDSMTGRIALSIAHCAGLVDMVALPIWIGALIAYYRFDPQQAGGLVTLFLGGVVVASLFFAPRFNQLRGRVAASLGFALAALAFFVASKTSHFGSLAALHAAGGFAVGMALSVTHGTVGRSGNPHRLFALVNTVLGVFAVIFLGVAAPMVAKAGGPLLFQIFSALMAGAAIVCALFFPEPRSGPVSRASEQRLPSAVWFGILAVGCMALAQSMIFSFVERVGTDHGFGVERVTAVLVAVGVVNLFPAAIAALLQKRLAVRVVLIVGPTVQAALALIISHSGAFASYAVASALFVSVMLFTHTFAFGALAQLDTSGRVAATTPAVLMAGAALGPVLGGTLVKGAGYGALGLAALTVDVLAVLLFVCMTRAHALRPAVS